MIIHNFDQRSDEWYKIRAGKLTASSFHTCLGNSETRNTLLLKITAERITGKLIENTYSNSDMERGVNNENIARIGYELFSDNTVQEVGFCELDDWVGSSPDGLVGEDGIIEIKCPKETVFLNQIIHNKIKPEYLTQIQFNLYVLDRKWCDYIAYNESFNLYVKRVERDEEYIDKIKENIERCKIDIQKNIELYNSKK